MTDKAIPPVDEQISRIEHTLREVEQQGQRFMMLAETLRAQVNELKNGPPKIDEPITDWSFVKEW
ncbi:MAG: hypothetical protein K9K82_10135 [Desulfobacteraceae bacterium]|nr:hypothetical protein [Desulfobacteraceae bacterium]